MEENIIGGVSPMKRRGKSRGKRSGGTVVGDTRYKRDKWQKPGGGGTYGDKPKVAAPAPTKPYVIKDGKVEMTPPGGTNITNEGDVNTINQTSGGGYTDETTTTPGTDDIYEDRTTMTTYQQAWDGKNFKTEDGKKKDIYGNVYTDDEEGFKKFKDATDAYNKEHGTTTKKTERVLVKKGDKGSSTTKRTYVPGGDNTASISTNKMLGSPGKYKIGGYRAMKAFRK